ncbi:MAG: sigma-70 family RNA polymerase sigma factor [Saprospiraceae bacterium]
MVILAEDKLMIEGCIAGKRDAQYQLYKKYCKAMFNICLRMVNDVNEAEDVLQNAFVDVFSKLKMFRYESTPGAWIKRIVVNNCINHIRSKKMNLVASENIPELAEENHDNEIQLNVSLIKNAIQKLPEGYRTIFCLYSMEGYDHSEISEILKISESTSKSQYSRARAKLYEILKSNGSINEIYQ